MFYLRALAKEGKEFWYTGRVVNSWLSENSWDAFPYFSQEEARRKATSFNRFSSLHGMWFMAVSLI